MTSHLEWSAPEYHHTTKTRDWYWAVGIISFTMAFLAIIFGNIIFAIFIILSAFTLCIHAVKPPETIKFELTNKGVVIKDRLYPYTTLESFWVELDEENPKILIKSKKLFVPFIIIPLHEDDAETAQEILRAYLKEEEHQEPLTQKIMEYFGF